MEQSHLKANYHSVLEAIAIACRAADRSPNSVRLIAVSKTHEVSSIRTLAQLGIRDFGENYAQELLAKAEELADLTINWHFIGHLQSNKINKLVQVCQSICTVTSVDHAKRIAKAARKLDKAPFPILLEINVDDETNKSGCNIAEALELGLAISKIPDIDLRGVFAVPAPLSEAERASPQAPARYLTLKNLASGIGAGGLSLGMSADLTQAIAAGSSEVRIGTALFGTRRNRVL